MTREEAKISGTSDLISRQEAIAEAEAYLNGDCMLDKEDFVSLIDDLKNLPSEAPGWIPCSERLPEEDGFYIATLDGEICGEDKPFSGLAEFENGKWVDDKPDYQCILAWMPLPEPYRPEEEWNMAKVGDKYVCEIKIGDAEAVKEAIDEAYQRGLSDAWEAARKIAVSAERGGFSFAELSNIFGTRKTDVIFAENTAAKAIEKIRAYEEWKKAEEEKIKVGDEVIIAGVTGIVTKVPEGDEKRVCYMDASGTVYCNNAEAEICKTGRHFPQIAELLQQMKE